MIGRIDASDSAAVGCSVTISVIIPTYNRAELVQQAVDSVLTQTHQPDEILVVDDGSEDETVALLQPLQAMGKIRVLRSLHSGMPGAARNRGIELASGEYIAFLDSDDLWMPDKLAQQLALVRRSCQVPMLVHTRECWNRNGREISQAGQRHRSNGQVFPDALKKCIIGPSTVLVRRELLLALGGFREDLPVAEDYELWLHVAARYPVQYIDQPLVEKRAGHGPQLSEQWGVIEYFRLRALLDFVGRHDPIPAPPGLPYLPANAHRAGWRAGIDMLPQIGSEQLLLAEAELARKLRVFVRGAAKRGNAEILDWYIQSEWYQEE
ncbi:glycosyltransferase family 2 protein [Spirochaeta africana]|uniref:Glycosyl transferase n=1 Tax=Spirochaeta africana (strain ATCC 700263 / DSM 8902 / Z-7692) TaxID=889378 RepID=H9UFS4_SPIAZ|nr:glycosyltransferase family A protein [Spirochaeta africana]AFG36367.1 glycosyl transferase [Spirochaeta africana DSM 8902]